jgi:hypothetical protein
MPNSSIKNEKLYEDLRKQGDSKVEGGAHLQRRGCARQVRCGTQGWGSGSYDD